MSVPMAALTPEAEQRLLNHVMHILLKGQVFNQFRITSISLPNTSGGTSGNAFQLIKNPLDGRIFMYVYNAGPGVATLTDTANNTVGLPIPALGNIADKFGPGVNWFIYTASTSSIAVAEFA